MIFVIPDDYLYVLIPMDAGRVTTHQPVCALGSVDETNQEGVVSMSMKDAYVEKLKSQMDEWKAEIDKLKAKADNAQADAKIEYLEQIDDLREKQVEATEKLAELQTAGESAWEDLKAGVESSWDSFEDAMKKAMSRFR